ncbi:MAG: hypothetical protein V1918_06445 [Planctomycetota bacterium]
MTVSAKQITDHEYSATNSNIERYAGYLINSFLDFTEEIGAKHQCPEICLAYLDGKDLTFCLSSFLGDLSRHIEHHGLFDKKNGVPTPQEYKVAAFLWRWWACARPCHWPHTEYVSDKSEGFITQLNNAFIIPLLMGLILQLTKNQQIGL